MFIVFIVCIVAFERKNNKKMFIVFSSSDVSGVIYVFPYLCSVIVLCLTVSQPGPALGMFEVFGRTGPQILAGRIFGP